MQKSFNTTLFRALLDFNLFLQKSKVSSKFNKHLKKSFYPKGFNSTQMFILEPVQLIKSLKQTIRLLQHLKNQPNPILYINSSERILSEWIQFLLEKKKNSLNNNIIAFKTNTFLKKNNHSNLFFSIGLNKNSFDIKKLFFDDIFLINILNQYKNNNDFGLYYFQNNINDWKKIIFLFILLKQTYKKINYEKNL